MTIDLWTGWHVTEVIDDTIEVDGVILRRAGVSAQSDDGLSTFGSAASVKDEPLRRAVFELLERIAIVEAEASDLSLFPAATRLGQAIEPVSRALVFPDSETPAWQYSRSSGVAIGETWADACRGAFHELAERDALLRAWYAQKKVALISLSEGMLPPTRSYTWMAVAVPTSAWAQGLHAVAAFAFPNDPAMPLLRGFAADPAQDVATVRAIAECLQNLAFLTEDPVPSRAPDPAPTPLFHLDSFLYAGAHPPLKHWLFGQSVVAETTTIPETSFDATPRYVDLTPRQATNLKVVRALHPSALALTFGDGPPWIPPPLRAHPIA